MTECSKMKKSRDEWKDWCVDGSEKTVYDLDEYEAKKELVKYMKIVENVMGKAHGILDVLEKNNYITKRSS